MEFKTTSRSIKYIWRKLLRIAQDRGYDHISIKNVVGDTQKLKLTNAELLSAVTLSKWILDDIPERYNIINGKTYRFSYGLELALIPIELATDRFILW